MKRVLLTGMSATGKSSVVEELSDRGFHAIDTDHGWSRHAPDGEWIWDEDRIRDFLATETADLAFVAGCASNQGKFYPQFDAIILLSAPGEVIEQRLATRTNNPFGSTPEQLAQILEDLDQIEPRLRRSATHEVVTTIPLDAVVSRIIELTAE
jgi:shikimate kinase